jgi:hypothetical protein
MSRDVPTADQQSYPPPQFGTWTLTAPDGRTWTGRTPLDLARQENLERVPPEERLRRLFRGIHEWLEQGIRLRTEGHHILVEVEHDKKFVEVIREFNWGAEAAVICHIVEPSGINSKILEALSNG